MPAKSEAQRRLLNAKFGHKWVKKHHFDNKGKLPAKVESLARTLIEGHGGGWGGRGGDWHGGRLKVPFNPRKKPTMCADCVKRPAFKPSTLCKNCEDEKQNFFGDTGIYREKPVEEGRDDAPKLGLGKTGLKFARMNSKEAFKTTDGTDEKWKTSLKLRAGLAGEKPSAKMQSRDAVGKVPRAMKGLGERITAEQVVAKLLA